jgi:hypothetical protein
MNFAVMLVAQRRCLLRIPQYAMQNCVINSFFASSAMMATSIRQPPLPRCLRGIFFVLFSSFSTRNAENNKLIESSIAQKRGFCQQAIQKSFF